MKNYSYIIWDWNGTLFDDVDWCIDSMNLMLNKRKMTPIADIIAYHQAFVFPIINYYKNVGFDFTKEPFENLAAEYIENYHFDKTGGSQLHPKAQLVLEAIDEMKISQIILSASRRDNLLAQLDEFDINKYFEAILGLSDIYAKSKIDLGLEYFTDKKIEKSLVIGDTVHDYELAVELEADCLLIASGHQSKEVLSSCGVPVLADISEVLKYLKS